MEEEEEVILRPVGVMVTLGMKPESTPLCHRSSNDTQNENLPVADAF